MEDTTELINETTYEQIFKYQTKFCEMLSDRDWNMFTKDEYPELYKTIGYSLYGPPSVLNEDETDATYKSHQQAKIQLIYNAILKYGSYDRVPGVIYMATIFIFGEDLKSKDVIYQTPVFRIRKCHSKIHEFDSYCQSHEARTYGQSIGEMNPNYCTIFIDDEARVYGSWELYLNNNNLPQCKMYVPINGFYQSKVIDIEKKISEVVLDIKLSPSCSMVQQVTNAADIVGTVGGIGSMAVCGLAAIPAISIAPAVLGGAVVVGVGTGVYSASRAVYGLINRIMHKQTVDLTNAEARGHWLNAAGGIVAGSAAGASKVISTAVGKGATIGMTTRTIFNIAAGANLLVNGSAVLNSLYVFKLKYKNKERISNLEIIQLTTSLLFFAHATWNVQSANTFINETQNSVLVEYEANINSIKKRKMFNKALKESERIKGSQVGRAEMIQGLRSITNHDEFFGTLVRNNKMFNENKARFTVSPDGKIQINNNMFIDSSEFASMSVTSKQNYFANLPENSVQSPNVKTSLQNTSTNVFNIPKTEILQVGIVLGKLIIKNQSVQEVINEIFSYFESDIRTILEDVISYVLTNVNDIKDDIKRVFHLSDTVLVILQFFFHYLEKYMRRYDSTTQNSNFNFCGIKPNALVQSFFVNKDKVQRLMQLIRSMDKVFINEIINSFRIWIKDSVAVFWEKYEQMKREISNSVQHDCSICKGVYYTVV